MKRVNNIYNKINDIEVIIDMYRLVRKNTKNKRKLNKFEDYFTSNIINIKNIINTRSYTPGKYNIFIIKEPKVRVIMSQNITDKVINHLVAKYFLIDTFDKGLYYGNVATRKNKGTHYGLRLFKKYYNYYRNKYKEFYILKFDISKYFYNIDHNIVKDIIRSKIKDKDVLNILFKIIDSTDEEYINKKLLYLKEKYNIELPIYKKGKGLPIGNMTSQIVACFYLAELDRFVVTGLGINCYIRYMDDGVLFCSNKEYLKVCLKKIEKVLDKYKLNLNPKTKIYSSYEEIEFLGFRFINNKKIIMKVNNKTKKKFKYNINYNNISSYLGHLSYGTCNGLISHVIKSM